MKYIVTAILFIISGFLSNPVFTAPACSELSAAYAPDSPRIDLTDKETSWIKAHPKVRFAVPSEFPPLLLNQKQNFTGILPDYITLISRQGGFQPEIIPTDSFMLSTSLLTDRVDAILSFDVSERRHLVHFSRPFMDMEMVIVSRKDESAVTALYDLNGKRIVILKGIYLHYEFARHHPQVIAYPADTLKDGMDAIAEGRADAMVIGLVMIKHLMKNYPDLALSDPVDIPLKPYMFAVREDSPELLSILNKSIDSLPEKEKKAILNKWFVIQVPSNFDWLRFYRWLLPAGLFFLITLAVFFFWNRRLSDEISRRRLAEKRLRGQSVFYEKIIHSASEGICVFHRIGRYPHVKFLIWNKRLEELTGYKMDEINCCGWSQMFYPSSENQGRGHKQIYEQMRTLLDDLPKGRQLQNEEWKIRKKNGQSIAVAVSTAHITSIDGTRCTLAIIRDLTKQKQADKELKTAKNAAEEKERAKQL